jgi:hypothetical protein
VSSVRVNIYEGRLDALVGDFAAELVGRCLTAGVNSAQRLVPVDTGDLQSDIGITQDPTPSAGGVVGAYGVKGDVTDYGLHVEYGTSVGPEQPYLRPSMDAVKAEARR